MPLGLIIFLSVYTAWAAATSAADTYYHERWWGCFEPRQEVALKAIPWPIRKGDIVGEPPAGTRNICTQEVYNGQWWTKQ